jgi:hypothetical protein
VQQILARVLTSAAIYLGAKLVEEVIKEMDRIDRETKRKSQSKLLSVLPRALEVIAGGRK